ncbi:NADP-dependent oxidoreductase domain-containing protein [Ilyonectria robusta]|uniref:NADP-dependent oxidoreductase domain-containing protein n=1 Tax=Ilyonectria robusta TaxID=1079257 RepID=UPI001E8EA651|nr:NADP-dependent oxidoreductase domain-containing protein [Ilyonectria robusta]KAH8687038.1 NADP-dependent oxidoreductase domain-containing protein [Ilyonectria robusta]
MSMFQPPPKPGSLLGYHRILSPNAAVKVSPLCLGGISIGSSWSSIFGKNDDPNELLDTYFALGGNFIDTSNVYNSEDSEKLIGDWLELRGTRDQMVIATKYTAGFRSYNRANEPLQSNFTGNSVKSMHISVRESLKKLKTDYIDILYVHWWDFGTSVEEVMRGLHAHVMAKEVLYLGISDTPAWVVVKANAYARANGLTPFSVYQGRWNAAYRDMEAELIPMCEDQGMAIMPWAALGGGQLLSAKQRDQVARDPEIRKGHEAPPDVAVCDALEKIAKEKNTTLQAIALAYLFHQSTYVFPIVGVNTVEHIRAMPDALRVQLTKEDVDAIHEASSFDPGFPMSFFYSYTSPQKYDLGLTLSHNQQYQMAAWVDAPPKPLPYRPHSE